MNAGYRMTRHARERAREMGLTDHQVIEIVLEATTTYTQTDGKRAGNKVAQKGEHAAVFDPRDRMIITVLFNTQDEYRR